jgi:hypothetical protein
MPVHQHRRTLTTCGSCAFSLAFSFLVREDDSLHATDDGKRLKSPCNGFFYAKVQDVTKKMGNGIDVGLISVGFSSSKRRK